MSIDELVDEILGMEMGRASSHTSPPALWNVATFRTLTNARKPRLRQIPKHAEPPLPHEGASPSPQRIPGDAYPVQSSRASLRPLITVHNCQG